MRLMVMSLTILGCFLASALAQPVVGATRRPDKLTRFFLTGDTANRA